MIIETGMPPQQYCLRWNNHRSNLLTVFDELLRNESFTDVTLVCEDGVSVKCHKMVLAACSSYFQCLFSELPCRHPVVVLKDIRYVDIKAILEYMYRGEVSIAQDQLAPLLKVAEALKVKGLVEENSYKTKAANSSSQEEEMNAISTSSSTLGISASIDNSPPMIANETSHHRNMQHHRGSPNHHHRMHNSPNRRFHNSPNSEHEFGNGNNNSNNQENANSINNSNNQPPPLSHHSANIETCSPPHSTSVHQTFQKSSYLYNNNNNNNNNNRSSSSCNVERSHLGRMSLPVWPIIALPTSTPPSPLSSVSVQNFNNYEPTNNSDIPPLKRKKSIFPANKDTPILRTVLGQGQADSSQPVSLVCHPEGQEQIHQSNGPTGYVKNIRSESISEDAHSPQMDVSFMEEEIGRQERINKIMHSSSSTSPQSYYSDAKGGVSSGIANYVPSQKPEWKRYKQYTRNDIMSAIESVRNGMSALQAAKKYGVPSRTLYDKVKKLGISTQRPFRRSSGGNSSHFPYSLTGPGGMMFAIGSEDEGGSQGMLEHGFLQHALEMGGKIRLETTSSDREIMSSTASNVVPSSHGLLQHALEISEKIKVEMSEREALSSMGPGNTSAGSSSSGPGDNRSPSPNLMKYETGSLSPLPADDNYEDQVEDLSISRKPEPPQSRVIMPPMNQATATALLTACSSESARN